MWCVCVSCDFRIASLTEFRAVISPPGPHCLHDIDFVTENLCSLIDWECDITSESCQPSIAQFMNLFKLSLRWKRERRPIHVETDTEPHVIFQTTYLRSLRSFEKSVLIDIVVWSSDEAFTPHSWCPLYTHATLSLLNGSHSICGTSTIPTTSRYSSSYYFQWKVDNGDNSLSTAIVLIYCDSISWIRWRGEEEVGEEKLLQNINHKK